MLDSRSDLSSCTFCNGAAASVSIADSFAALEAVSEALSDVPGSISALHDSSSFVSSAAELDAVDRDDAERDDPETVSVDTDDADGLLSSSSPPAPTGLPSSSRSGDAPPPPAPQIEVPPPLPPPPSHLRRSARPASPSSSNRSAFARGSDRSPSTAPSAASAGASRRAPDPSDGSASSAASPLVDASVDAPRLAPPLASLHSSSNCRDSRRGLTPLGGGENAGFFFFATFAEEAGEANGGLPTGDGTSPAPDPSSQYRERRARRPSARSSSASADPSRSSSDSSSERPRLRGEKRTRGGAARTSSSSSSSFPSSSSPSSRPSFFASALPGGDRKSSYQCLGEPPLWWGAASWGSARVGGGGVRSEVPAKARAASSPAVPSQPSQTSPSGDLSSVASASPTLTSSSSSVAEEVPNERGDTSEEAIRTHGPAVPRGAGRASSDSDPSAPPPPAPRGAIPRSISLGTSRLVRASERTIRLLLRRAFRAFFFSARIPYSVHPNATTNVASSAPSAPSARSILRDSASRFRSTAARGSSRQRGGSLSRQRPSSGGPASASPLAVDLGRFGVVERHLDDRRLDLAFEPASAASIASAADRELRREDVHGERRREQGIAGIARRSVRFALRESKNVPRHGGREAPRDDRARRSARAEPSPLEAGGEGATRRVVARVVVRVVIRGAVGRRTVRTSGREAGEDPDVASDRQGGQSSSSASSSMRVGAVDGEGQRGGAGPTNAARLAPERSPRSSPPPPPPSSTSKEADAVPPGGAQDERRTRVAMNAGRSDVRRPWDSEVGVLLVGLRRKTMTISAGRRRRTDGDVIERERGEVASEERRLMGELYAKCAWESILHPLSRKRGRINVSGGSSGK
ncbi:hypothetical protein ACHAWF_018536 [Thalassiosira exigua]